MAKVPQVFDFIKNEAHSYGYLRKLRWKGKIHCPYCACLGIHRHGIKTKLNRRYLCPHCRKTFTDRTGTIMDRSKVPVWKWFYALFEFSQKKGISAVELRIKLSISYPVALKMLRKVREVVEEQIQPHTLYGIVEADEAWVNGIIVQGVVVRHGEVAMEILPDVKEATLQAQIRGKVKKNSLVLTDERYGYYGLSIGYRHRHVNHSKEFVEPLLHTHTNTIEGVWSHLKRLLGTIYHGVWTKYLKLYLAEFVYRYNFRNHSNLFSHLASLVFTPRYCLY
jgi:transposase-like protein